MRSPLLAPPASDGRGRIRCDRISAAVVDVRVDPTFGSLDAALRRLVAQLVAAGRHARRRQTGEACRVSIVRHDAGPIDHAGGLPTRSVDDSASAGRGAATPPVPSTACRLSCPVDRLASSSTAEREPRPSLAFRIPHLRVTDWPDLPIAACAARRQPLPCADDGDPLRTRRPAVRLEAQPATALYRAHVSPIADTRRSGPEASPLTADRDRSPRRLLRRAP